MNIAQIYTGVIALFAIQSSSALTFEITGSTSSRYAVIDSIYDLYSGGAFRLIHNGPTQSDFRNADVVTFEGQIAGITGSTVIRCSFNGSAQGLRALAEPGSADAKYFKQSALTIPASIQGAIQQEVPTAANTETAEAEFAVSDIDDAYTPYAGHPAFLLSPPTIVSIVVYGLVSSEGSGVTSVTRQQSASLVANGLVRLSMFTGVATDTRRIFSTGRNDGAGARTNQVLEIGYQLINPVQQYMVVGSEGNQITALQQVPAGGVNDLTDPSLDISNFDAQPSTSGFQPVTQDPRSASTVWGQDMHGNGGAYSGSVLSRHLGLVGSSVRVFDGDGYDLFGTPQDVGLVAWLSLNDAVSARALGANLCSFDGISLAVTDPGPNGGSVMTALDKQKVRNGAYSAWSHVRLYRSQNSHSSNEAGVLFGLLDAAMRIPRGAAGMALDDMNVGRISGGTINPFE